MTMENGTVADPVGVMQELALLLLASGAVQVSIHSAFDDQAYLAVAEKPLR